MRRMPWLAVVLVGCSHPSPEEPAPTGGCQYTYEERQCTLGAVEPGRGNSDDPNEVSLTVRYDTAGAASNGTTFAPWTKVYPLPRERVDAVTAHFRAHAQAGCKVAILVAGACPPDSTQVEEVHVPAPPLVAPHPAVASIDLVASGGAAASLAPPMPNFAPAMVVLERHGYFEGAEAPAEPVAAGAPAPASIVAHYQDGTTRTLRDDPGTRARFEACKNALRVELPDLPAPWGLAP